MKQDDVIQLAKDAGLLDSDFEVGDWEIHEFTTFAKLVAAHEREILAKYFDNMPSREMFGGTVADEIRARGQQ